MRHGRVVRFHFIVFEIVKSASNIYVYDTMNIYMIPGNISIPKVISSRWCFSYIHPCFRVYLRTLINIIRKPTTQRYVTDITMNHAHCSQFITVWILLNLPTSMYSIDFTHVLQGYFTGTSKSRWCFFSVPEKYRWINLNAFLKCML